MAKTGHVSSKVCKLYRHISDETLSNVSDVVVARKQNAAILMFHSTMIQYPSLLLKQCRWNPAAAYVT